MTAISTAVRRLVLTRDGWACRRCGRPVSVTDYSIHHRRARGMGGSKNANNPANLVTLCGSGTTGCHGWVESHRAEAYETGWLVRRNSIDDPEEIPIIGPRGRYFLTDNGSVITTTREDNSA